MSAFLLNHPIFHTFVLDVLLTVFGVGFAVTVATTVRVLRVPASVWLRARSSRLRWIVAVLLSFLLYPAALIVALGWAGHDGLLLCLPSLLIAGAWWLHTQQRLQAHAAELGVPWPDQKASRQLYFGPADTTPLKIIRFVVLVLACIGFGVAQHAVINWSTGDPTFIDSVGTHGTIHPRPYILAACPASVHQPMHLIGFVTLNGDYYQRWSVVPMPGHLDQVLLDTDTGTVICP